MQIVQNILGFVNDEQIPPSAITSALSMKKKSINNLMQPR